MSELFLNKLRLSTVDYVASNNKSHGGCLLNCAVVIHHALELISGSVNGEDQENNLKFRNCTMAQISKTTYCHAIVSGLREENIPSFFCALS